MKGGNAGMESRWGIWPWNRKLRGGASDCKSDGKRFDSSCGLSLTVASWAKYKPDLVGDSQWNCAIKLTSADSKPL